MANKFEFINYMADCAVKLKDIAHSDDAQKFFRISGIAELDELLTNLSKAQFPALLAEENHTGAIADRSTSNNYLDSPYYTFYVVKHAPFEDHDTREAAKLQTKQIGLKIIARILRHKLRGEQGLTFVQFGNIPYQSIGPIGDNCYGCMFSITVPDVADVFYNAEDWEE